MTTSTHGGPRFKTRDDDARGKHHSPKPGSGRKPKSFTLKLGQKLFVGAHDKDGVGIADEYAWTVTDIDRTHVTIRSDVSGNTYRLVR